MKLLAGLVVGALIGWNFSGFEASTDVEPYGQGCCSGHEGQSGSCTPDGRVICNDGTISPKCRC